MYEFSILSISLYALLFACAITLAFYIPGSVLLRRFNLPVSAHIPLAFITGMSVWALQGFVFGFLQARWITYEYLLIFFLLWIKEANVRTKWTFAVNKTLVSLIIAGVVIQLTTILFTMIPTQGGLFFCCGDPNDNTWFAAITNELTRAMPPNQPGMVGMPLYNYHFLSNLVVADISRIFQIPFLLVQYQYMPIVLSILYGGLAVVFGRLLGLSHAFIGWLIFFLYFGSDAIIMVLFLLGKGLNFSMSSMEDGVRFLANLPRAYAMVLALGFLNLFIVWLKKRELFGAMVLGLVAASLVGFKVYVGIFVFAGLGACAMYELLRFRDIRPMWALLAGVLVAAGVYLPINAEAGGLYFTGLWRFENFIVQPALGLVHLEQARIIYANHNNWIRVAINESIYIFLFVISIFGSKLAGFFQTRLSIRKFPLLIHIFLVTGIAVSIVPGLFFDQTTGSSNTFNFLVSVFIFLSFYAALTMAYAIGKFPIWLRGIFVVAVIVITIPRIAFEATRNITNIVRGNHTVVKKTAIDASLYLKSHTSPQDIVLVDNRDFLYDTNAPMFSILVDRPMYLSGVGLLKHFGVDTAEREKIVRTIVASLDEEAVATMFVQTGIDYLISSSQAPPASTQSAIFLPIFYQNQDVTIRKVDAAIAAKIYQEAQIRQKLQQTRR